MFSREREAKTCHRESTSRGDKKYHQFKGIIIFIYIYFITETRFIKLEFQIASHPNLYILDTPGILPPEILDAQLSSKLALTGTI